MLSALLGQVGPYRSVALVRPQRRGRARERRYRQGSSRIPSLGPSSLILPRVGPAPCECDGLALSLHYFRFAGLPIRQAELDPAPRGSEEHTSELQSLR